MEYKDLSCKKLKYRFISGEVDVNSINVLKTKKIEFGSIIIELNIIGESHLIKYTINGQVYYDILACVDLNDCNNLVDFNLENVDDFKFRSNLENYGYSCELKTEKLSEVNIDGDLIEYEFPSNGDVIPKTKIFWKKSEGKIKIYTVHMYPNEDKNVITKIKVKK